MKMNLKKTFKTWLTILKNTFSDFGNDNGLKLSGSLAYVSVFAIGPLLLLIMSLAGIFYKQNVQERLYPQMVELIGSSAATQVQDLIRNLAFSGKTSFALVTSILVLVLGATGIFIEIQTSLNLIWNVKAKPKKGWLQFLKNRAISIALIISLGLLLVLSFLLNGIIAGLGKYLEKYISGDTIIIVDITNYCISFIIVCVLFGVMFKFLPDVKILWRDVRSGALFTGVLFMLGRYLIGLYIQTTGTGSTYGAAGAIIILLVWIYYTSAIFYIGAEFTEANSKAFGRRIQPASYAVKLEYSEIEVSK